MLGPNSANSAPKSASEVPPVSHDVNPSRTFAAVSASIAPAKLLTPSITVESTAFTPLINGIAFVMNVDNSVPNVAKLEPPDIIEATPVIKSAAVNASIAPAKIPTPANTVSSTILTPLINGIAFVINWDSNSPICGNPSATPVAKPFTRFPTRDPMP